MPKVLSTENRQAFSRALSEYVKSAEIAHCAVIFHGGEPLLIGVDALVEFSNQLRTAVGAGVTLDIGLQTNGLLLSKETLTKLQNTKISVSLSLDGPEAVNDLHRTSRAGKSSFSKVLTALELLKNFPDIFAGVIAVIDPQTDPAAVLDFFASHKPPKLDFLLPDAHHIRPPPGREENPNLYQQWLISAFDLWLDKYPELKIRTFEALLDSIAGLPSHTDAFGFGDVSLITLETDGSYHDLDVLKVVKHGATRIGGTVRDTSIADIAKSSHISAHRQMLRKEGVSPTCQACDIVDICGGGSLPHRYNLNGFENPTVYCGEMYALIKHASKRLQAAIQKVGAVSSDAWQGDLGKFDYAEDSNLIVSDLYKLATDAQVEAYIKALASLDRSKFYNINETLNASDDISTIACRPGTVAWSYAATAVAEGKAIYAIDGSDLDISQAVPIARVSYQTIDGFEVHLADTWIRKPFGNAIHFESDDNAKYATHTLQDALNIIKSWNPALFKEMQLICKAIQFVKDPDAHPEKIVSFSDNSVPGALFVSIFQGENLIDPYDLADSLIHEYRHQKLYLLERCTQLVTPNSLKLKSPWREDLRPPSGLFHAVFVFVELRRFWQFVLAEGPSHLHTRAKTQLDDTNRNLEEGITTLAACPLTNAGQELLASLNKARLSME